MSASAVSHGPLLPVVRWFGRRTPWQTGLSAALTLGFVGSFALLAGAVQSVAPDRLLQSAIQLWVNTTAIGYALGIARYETRRLCADLDGIRHLLVDAAALDDPRLFERNRHPRALLLITLAGALFGAAFNYQTNGLLGQLLDGRPPAWEFAWGPLVLITLWAVVFHVLQVLLDGARLLSRIARRHVRVDLVTLAGMDVFANAGIRNLLMLIVGLAVIPIQAILAGNLRPMDFLPALSIVLPAGMILLALPVLAARNAIADARARELGRIDEALRGAEEHSDRHLLLALYRAQVAATPAWPLSLRSVARIGLYLVIPPLTWVAAALVETLVSGTF